MKAIVAMDPNRGIGYKGTIPWSIPKELQWFKEFTWNRTIIVGRTTFESLPILKNRDIVVLSNSIPSLIEYHIKYGKKCRNLFLRNSITFNYTDFPDAIVAGGTKVYLSLLPLCKEIFVSHIIDEYESDTYMPIFEEQFSNSEIIKEYKDFWVVRYWK